MGLTSALNTSLNGLRLNETSIDVLGNNIANAGTNGFKTSSVRFATQLSQTLSVGSRPRNRPAAPTRGRSGWAPASRSFRATSRKAASATARIHLISPSREMVFSCSMDHRDACIRETATFPATATPYS